MRGGGQCLEPALDLGRGNGRERLHGQEPRESAQHTLGHVLAVGAEQVLAVDVHRQPLVVRERLHLLLDVVRHALLDHEHPTLAAQEVEQLLGHERVLAPSP